jgi:two-component system phosphate regulon sensor histidine kinase PhoR
MAVLSEASKFLSTPEGGLVYHMLVFWALFASLGMAWGEWKRARNEHGQRLLVAMAGMLAARAVYAMAALVTSLGWIEQAAVFPPLEQFAETVSLGLLAWAFMPGARRGVRAWDWFLGVNLAAAVVTGLLFIFLWRQALAGNASLDYNTYWQSTVWMVWQVGLALIAGFAAIRSQREGWVTLVLALVFVLVGVVGQWLSAGPVPNVPGWHRLADMVAYPLIAVAVFQDIVSGMRVRSRELQDISQASLDQIKSLLTLFEASQQTGSSLDLTVVLDHAVRGVAQILDADQCAIVFPEESDSGTMRLVAIYNPTRQGRGEAVTFPLDYQLTVQQAMRRKKPVIVEESENVQLKVLFALLGSGETGPLLVQPLLTEEDVLGAIIAGNARSRRPFTPNDAKLCQSMAMQISAAIENARLYQDTQAQIQQLNKTYVEERRRLEEAQTKIQQITSELAESHAEMGELVQREETAREARNALEIQLVSSRAEVEALSKRLADLDTDLVQAVAQSEAQLSWYREEVARLQQDWERTVQSAESFQAVVQGITAGVLITDENGVIQEANQTAKMLLDVGEVELGGLALEEISGDERWLQAIAAARGGKAIRLTTQIGVKTVMCDLAPLPDREASPDEAKPLIAVFQDISAEVEQERIRLDTIAALAQELRTPITTILNYADLLLSESVGGLGSPQRKFLTRIKAGAERMAQMTNDLTREMSAEERWLRPQRQVVDVGKLIEVALAGSHCQLEDKEIDLDLDLAEDLPSVKADPDYLRRVLANLLSNACLASSEGGRIRVQAAQPSSSGLKRSELEVNGDGYVIVSVKDSGGGLSDDALDRVFDRSRPSRTPPGLGESGAGLALVKTLIEAHGGRMWVESEPGVGTTFSFILPANDVGKNLDQRRQETV